jgi:neopullulanase
MRGGADPDNRRNFPGGFGPTQDNAFNPAGRSPEQQRAFSSLKNLLALRDSHPALQTGTEQLLHADKNTLVYVRTLTTSTHGIQRTLVAVNKGSEAADVVIKTDETEIQNTQRSTVLLGSPSSISMNTGALTVHLAANAAVISDLD